MFKPGSGGVLPIMLILCCVLAATLLGESLAAGKKDKDEVKKRPFQILKPEVSLEPAAESPSVQEIGGVRVELVRLPFEIRSMYFVNVQERESGWESVTGIRMGTASPVWIGVLPFYNISPQNLRFKVRITNHLGRVLRLQGVALQFVKDGETLSIENVENDLNKVMILPENTWEGTLNGPTLDAFGLKVFDARAATAGGLLEAAEVRSEGVLLMGLYDVVTAMDNASNATTRSNFEWIFGYKASAVPEDAEAIKWKGRLTPEQVEKFIGVRSPEDLAGTLPTE